MTSVLGTNSFI